MSWGIRAAAWGVAAVLVLGLAVVGFRLWSVHQQTADWALWPNALPSRVQYAGRDFNCGPHRAVAPSALDGLSAQGKTAGGGDIYAAAPPAGWSVTTMIVVKTDDGAFACNLMGAPRRTSS